jgi:hypothetical protein
MNGLQKRVVRLREDPADDAALRALVKTINRLASALESRTMLGLAGGNMRHGAGGFTLRGGVRAGGGSGLLPPFYATGGQGKVRFEPGFVFDQYGVATMPTAGGVPLNEGGVLSVPDKGTGWVVLRIELIFGWESFQPPPFESVSLTSGPPTCDYEIQVPEPYDILSNRRIQGARMLWVGNDVPRVQVNVSREQVFLNVLAARVWDGRVFPVLATNMRVSLPELKLVWIEVDDGTTEAERLESFFVAFDYCGARRTRSLFTDQSPGGGG